MRSLDRDPLSALPYAARELLQSARVGRLATLAPGGEPHVVPVCYVVHGGRIYSVVDQKPKRTARLQRLRNIEANRTVALVADRYDEDWSTLAWVMVRGEAAVLEGGEEHAAALMALRAKYPQYLPMDLDDRPVIRLSPDRANAWSAG